MEIKIIGNGQWGNALYSLINKNSHSVSFLKRGEKTSHQDVVILATPTQAIRSSLENVTFSGKSKIIINATKGIEQKTHLLPSQICHSVVGADIEYYSLIGPGFAQEVIKEMPTIVNLGYGIKNSNTKTIQELFQTNFFRVRLSKGIEVLETSAAFKNIYAIACGLAQGLGYQTNTRIKLMILAIDEMRVMYKNLGLKIHPDATPGVLGDLILTCNSTESRNFKFGTLLATSLVKDSIHQVERTIEGYNSLSSLDYFKKHAKVELPLATFIYQMVQNDNPKLIKKSFDEFVKKI